MTNQNSIQVFNNTQFGSVRIVTNQSNQPLFCLTDVCSILGLDNTAKVKTRLDANGCIMIDLNTVPNKDGFMVPMLGNSMATFITEDNFYDCVFDSVKPEAKVFRKWVTSEVLPQIRQTGGYIPIAAEETIEETMARMLIVANKTLELKTQRLQILEEQSERQRKQIGVLQPKADYTDNVLQSVNTYTTTQVAKALNFRSATALHTSLVMNKVLFLQSGQYQLSSKYAGNGYTQTRTHQYKESLTGREMTNSITVWTEKGKKFLHEYFNK